MNAAQTAIYLKSRLTEPRTSVLITNIHKPVECDMAVLSDDDRKALAAQFALQLAANFGIPMRPEEEAAL